MSKKSRKRNKKILAAIGLGLGAAAMASKKRNASIADNEANESGFAASTKKPSIAAVSGTKKDTAKKETTVTTPKTIKDNQYDGPKNPKSIIVKKNTNEVFKRKDGPDSSKVGNSKSNFKGEDGYIRRGENATPMTGGRFGTSRAASEISKGALPPQLRTPKKPETYNEISPFAAKNGGRANYQSGGKVKGCGKALRGFGKAMKGKR